MTNSQRIMLNFIVSTLNFGTYVPALAQISVPPSIPAVTLPVPIVTVPSMPLPATQLPRPTGVGALILPLDPIRTEMLTKDLSDLATMLGGRWDNESQSFFEAELNVPIPQKHDRLHTLVRPIDGGLFGANAFYVEYRSGGESGSIVRQRIWILSLDEQLGALRLATFTPKEGKQLEGAWRDPAKLAALKPADFIPVTGCDIIWRRRADGFSGETRPGACKVITTGPGQRIVTVTERHDVSPSTWDVRDIGVDDRGTRIFGSADNAPTRLKRANPFLCWAGLVRSGEPTTRDDLILHDQGGVATAALAGATPSTITLRLRNVEWPIGQNRPSLTLYVMTGNDPNAKAYAWSEPDAKRIALDVNGTQASCTRDERALWR